MAQTTEIESLLNQAATRRLRFENVVNELLDDGLIAKDELVISPERTSAYNFERDIQEIRDRSNDLHERLWQIEIPRDGFYDTLPERMFHRAKKRTKDEDEWAEIRQQEEKQEQESREFFLPFDSEFNHQRAAIARFETRTLAGDDELLVSELLKLVAPDAETFSLTNQQKLTLFLLISQAYQVVGNWELTAYYFSSFLQAPVQIRYGRQVVAVNRPAGSASSWQPNRLGDGRLGLDWVLPQPAMLDDGGLIRLTIGPLTDSQLHGFLPGGSGIKHVQLLAGYLFPVDADWRMDILTDAVNEAFMLSASGTAGRLGLTSTLS
ncbi:type VI secretion system baseplate subunit TssG [Spirosoma aureum]|uniref:Type VI secretion system baseplate subunit TssG n=1 Tax=Spirosoma aureum TaxID=2692134 RepID=A0A6G9AKU0_9BACT|nr:type VI secretion system baseplate subunit TssG [Spirosoma aureum]QIP13091.1 type VI secretion system baseplate subunit TssG [Spirosoma aureum]